MAHRAILVLFAFSVTVWLQTAAQHSRSDDSNVQSLMPLVQQQAATIQAMQAQLTSLQTTVQQQSAIITNLTGDLTTIKQRSKTQVAFMAHTTQSGITMLTEYPVKFDAVVTNIGGAYNPSSGVFVAPVSGVYVFYAQIMNYQQTSGIHWAIDKSGAEICRNAIEQQNYYDKSSCLATVAAAKGERVFVRGAEGGTTTLQGGSWCSFNGFLLSLE